VTNSQILDLLRTALARRLANGEVESAIVDGVNVKYVDTEMLERLIRRRERLCRRSNRANVVLGGP